MSFGKCVGHRELCVWFFMLAMIVLGLNPSRSSAAVYWDDGLEPGNTGYPLVGGMSYATSPVYGGTHSLKQHFIGTAIQGLQGGTYTDRYVPATEELWSRYYLYLDNFVVDETTQTKLMFQGSECCYPSFWWGMLFGQPSLSVQVQGIHGGTETVNIYGPSIPQNRWVCVETHIRMNTPGVANGVIEAWLDGAQGIARYDVNMRDNSGGKNSPTANFVLNRLYVQFGIGDLYFDNLATGDQRIGCSGVPPVQSQVPPAPQPVQNPQPAPSTPAPTQPVQAPSPSQPALLPPPAPEDLFFR